MTHTGQGITLTDVTVVTDTDTVIIQIWKIIIMRTNSRYSKKKYGPSTDH